MEALPLLDLFTRLREAGLPLGIDDYQLVLEALQAGFGIGERAALAHLCCTLWIKTKEERRIFDYYFEQIVLSKSKDSDFYKSSQNVILLPEQLNQESTIITQSKASRQPRVWISKTIDIISAGILLLVFGIISSRWLFSNHPPAFTSYPITKATCGAPYKYEITAHDVNGDEVKIEASVLIEVNNEFYKYRITERGIDNYEQVKSQLKSSTWLTFKNQGSGKATLSGIVDSANLEAQKQTIESQKAHFPERDNPIQLKVELQAKDQKGKSGTQQFTISCGDRNMPVIYLVLLVLAFFAVPVALYFIYRNSKISNSSSLSDINSPSSNSAMEENKSTSIESTASPELQSPRQDLVNTHSIGSSISFKHTDEFFPLTRRQMKQSWRFLRRMVRMGTPMDLDITATIERIGRQGILLEPAIVPRRTNRIKLLFLMDQEGSMFPFHILSDRLIETAVRGGRLENIDIYYFHNCPTEYLYSDRYYQIAEPLTQILKAHHASYTSVLIFSDAGAARGELNPERLELTITFLNTLKQHIRHVAWLNPMPCSRWRGTTASQIERSVPMFEFSRHGLNNAIAVLRGQPKHY